MTTERSPAAFLDRDGTMIVEHGYLGEPDRVSLLPGAGEAVRLLNGWGYRVIGVSNQSGVARGYYDAAAVDTVNERVLREFAQVGARIDRIYYCTHLPVSYGLPGGLDCDCRKPAAGMVAWAERDFALDLKRSFVAGDRAADVGLAQTLGIPGCLVLTGFGREEHPVLPPDLQPAHVADDLLAAVHWWGRKIGKLA